MATEFLTAHASTYQLIALDGDAFRLSNLGEKGVFVVFTDVFPDATDKGHVIEPGETISRNRSSGDVYARAVAKDVRVAVTKESLTNTVSQTGTGQSSTIVPLPGNPFNMGFGVTVSGSDITYSVQQTYDGSNWFNHATVVSETTSQEGVYDNPVAGIRLNVTASGTSFSVVSEDANPTDITWDGTNFWVIGNDTDAVYKYTAAGVYTGTSFSVVSEDSIPVGITWDGTNFWVIGASTDAVYKYDSAGTYTGTSFSVASEDNDPRGITWDGTNFWVVGTSTDAVYKYDSAGTYTGTSFSVASEDTDPRGITHDGTDFWVVGNISNTVYKYTAAGVYTGTSFSVASEDTIPTGITHDGTDFWVVGTSADAVYKYTADGEFEGTATLTTIQA